MTPFEHVLAPIDVGPVTLPNRITRAPHHTSLYDDEGMLGDDFTAYHEARAAGGVGLTILEVSGVHSSYAHGLNIRTDAIVSSYQRFVDRMSRYDMRIFQQLNHAGRIWDLVDDEPPWAPSAVPWAGVHLAGEGRPTAIAMTRSQIDELIECYAISARRAMQGGLHGVEVQCGHDYLIHQFLSPLSNVRDDDYGGSFENRLRLAREVLSAIRSEVGRSIAVGIRVSSDGDSLPGGLTPATAIEITKALEATGLIDFVDASYGGHSALTETIATMAFPPGHQLDAAAGVARAVEVPTIVNGRILSLEQADEIIAAGRGEMVSMVRALIADPELVRKSRQGRSSQVRPCIGCNQGCIGAFASENRLGCTVNAAAGRELALDEATITLASSAKRVVVVGGGPAGLEAARVAALRGHNVILCEASHELGGQLTIARKAPLRGEIGKIVDWLVAELERLDVDVRCRTACDAASVRELAPDAVIVATGAVPRRDGFQAIRPAERIAGADESHVLTSWEAVGGAAETGDSAVILDDIGHYEAIAVADSLYAAGVETIHYVTRYSTLGTHLKQTFTDAPARQRLSAHDFTLYPWSELVSVSGRQAVIRSIDSDRTVTVSANTAVLVSGSLSRGLLGEELSGDVEDVVVVGDARSPRYLTVAIREAHRNARGL